MTSLNEPNNTGQLTFSSPDHPASHSVSPESVSDWMTLVATSLSSPLEFVDSLNPGGLSSRTYPACLRAEGGTTTLPSSIKWKNAGMRVGGVSLTLNMPEWHSDAAASLLSDILETTGDHLQRYSLSQKACAGILRRAEKRGKKLPPILEAALMTGASSEP